MKTLDFIRLDEKKVALVAEELKQLLADFQVFYTNLRGMHWNIKGHGFFILHEKFEGMYNDAAEKVDEIAERLLQLGHEPESRFSEYLKKAAIKEAAGIYYSDDAIKNIMESYKILMDEERKVIELAGEANDEVTVAMMSDFLVEQEKLIWMLVAYNSGK